VNRPAPHADQIFKRDDSVAFTALEDTFTFTVQQGTIAFTLSRLRRERGYPVGEVTVRTSLPGARTFGPDGTTLFTQRLGLLWPKDKAELSMACQRRSATTLREVPWDDYIEDFAQRVLAVEQAGQPLGWVHAAPRPEPDRVVRLFGMPLHLDHSQILFGAADTGKSLLALAMLGELGRQGLRTLILDWEMDIGIHKERHDGLGLPPTVAHMRCDAPLVVLADGIRQRCLQHQIGFLLIDSVILACDGPPEDATVARAFNSALRRIGRGNLLLAHTRAEDPSHAREPQQQRPFGSVVWHNSARQTWFVKRVNPDTPSTTIVNGYYNPKHGLQTYTPPFGLTLTVTPRADGSVDYVEIVPTNLADDPELAATLPLHLRLKAALARGPLTVHELADAVLGSDAKPAQEKLRVVLKRKASGDRPLFTLVVSRTDGVHRWALAEPSR